MVRSAGNGPGRSHEVFPMADKVVPTPAAAQAALPGLPTFDEAVLRSRTAYERGRDDAFFLRKKRRSSIDAVMLQSWDVVDFLAYKLGLEDK